MPEFMKEIPRSRRHFACTQTQIRGVNQDFCPIYILRDVIVVTALMISASVVWYGSTMGLNMNKILILGAAGRDFHNFNVVFRDHAEFRVVGFTAAQIPGIASRRYPSELAGDL
jgi:hypothetical protein